MENKNRISGDILSTITLAVLFLVIIILVVFGASSYKNSNDKRSGNENSRAILSYVTSAIKDSSGREIRIKKFGDKKGLIIPAEDGGYVRRIYMNKDKLVEEYAAKESGIKSDDALVIGKVKEFSPDFIGKGLLRIRTDQGTTYVRTER